MNTISRFLIALFGIALLTGCTSSRTVTRYGPAAALWPKGVSLDGARPTDFATKFDAQGFMAHGKSSSMGEARSSWGYCTFQFNGKTVVVESYIPAGEARLDVITVDGKYNTQLGRNIMDWMIQQSGLRERHASWKRPAKSPTNAAHFYGPSLFAFTAESEQVAKAVQDTAIAKEWKTSKSETIDARGVTVARYAFTTANGNEVQVKAVTLRYEPSIVEVVAADESESLAI